MAEGLDPDDRLVSGPTPPMPSVGSRANGADGGTLGFMILGLRGRGATLVLGWMALGGCKEEPGGTDDLRGHCSDLQGDGTCLSFYSNRPYCSLCEANNNGCVLLPPAPVCQPAADTGVSEEDGSTTDATMGSSGTTQTSLPLDSTGGSSTGEPPCEQEGEVDPGCLELDAARPFCLDAVCVGCEAAGGDAFCGERDALTPACDTVAGDCVGCGAADHAVCGEATPVCDASGGCLSCTAHAQCPGSACHLGADDPLLGRCFAPDEVIHVDNESPCPGLGTPEAPLCSLGAAAATLVPGDARVLRIAGGTPYLERAAFAGAMTVAIIGDGLPVFRGSVGQQAATLMFDDGVIAYVQGVELEGNTLTHGLMCSFSTLRMADSRVRNNDGWGLFDFDPCTIELERVVIAGNEDGGVRVSEGELTLVNTTVAVNGVGASSSGLRLLGTDATILYSTIAGNDGAGADSIECTDATGSLRNSIVTGVDAFSIALDCFPLSMSHNAIDAANFVAGTNIEVDPYNAAYFSNPAQGDMTLSAPPLTPFGDVALWVAGDPDRDAEGTLRPTDGTLGYPGIDEP
jgi:hypothetical protein